MIDPTTVLVALIGAGLFKAVVDGIKWVVTRRKVKAEAATPDGRHAVLAVTLDASLAVVARARDELEADNVRLRAEIAEKDARYAAERTQTDARHEADRARWELRDRSRREEIEVLERKLRALLAEVEKLKDRHTFDEISDTHTRIHLPPSHGTQYPGAQPN